MVLTMPSSYVMLVRVRDEGKMEGIRVEVLGGMRGRGRVIEMRY